ncbi:MAG TPA: histidinol dehydrogenase [Bacteroidales bacterium]|nr:histidinol dehydrogenase [Bacteroidales bacterium]HBZ20226.1 histidinol dehydrogenase [Bacteroidales bacterium]
MKIFRYPEREKWDSFCKRPSLDRSGLEESVASVLRQVKSSGDKAIFEFSVKFDSVSLKSLRVTGSEIAESADKVPASLKDAIDVAKSNIEKFHGPQLFKERVIETTKGVFCWRKNVPIGRVGLYIPGGTAPLFSTVLMLAVPAKIAGCPEIILCTPPDRNGNINPFILYTAHIAGVTDIFRIGGAQAIAAMAYGTETVPKADKIFGPGNQYVTKAKEMVQLDGTQIDIPAGPSEVLVIADKYANPSFVASDLLAQAEHGTDSQVILLTESSDLLNAVEAETNKQVALLPRKNIALKALENSSLILLNSLNDCIEMSNLYAPEHLIISTSEPQFISEQVRNAGSVFIGKYSCESAGDYASGTNHTLPTSGYAKSFSGVSVDSFVKKITFQQISAEGLRNLGPVIEKMAEAELLHGHKSAVTLRLNSLGNE